MSEKLRASLLAIGLFSLLNISSCESGYVQGIEKWRSDHEVELKKEDGWLTLAGLYWLKEGFNTVGKGPGYDVALTDNFKGDKFGSIEFRDGKATLTVEPGVDATVDGRPVTSVDLKSDDPGPATNLHTGTETFYLIKREDRYGIRLKDSQAPERINFQGEHWFPVDENFRVTGTLEPFASDQDVEVPNVLGGAFTMKSPGIVKFRLNGKEQALQPVIEDEKTLFFIFKDPTSGNETYAAGRFLYTDKPLDGKVVLDFNKAEDPPCAFTKFATCPLPLPQNRLDVAIKAGELRTH